MRHSDFISIVQTNLYLFVNLLLFSSLLIFYLATPKNKIKIKAFAGTMIAYFLIAFIYNSMPIILLLFKYTSYLDMHLWSIKTVSNIFITIFGSLITLIIYPVEENIVIVNKDRQNPKVYFYGKRLFFLNNRYYKIKKSNLILFKGTIEETFGDEVASITYCWAIPLNIEAIKNIYENIDYKNIPLESTVDFKEIYNYENKIFNFFTEEIKNINDSCNITKETLAPDIWIYLVTEYMKTVISTKLFNFLQEILNDEEPFESLSLDIVSGLKEKTDEPNTPTETEKTNTEEKE